MAGCSVLGVASSGRTPPGAPRHPATPLPGNPRPALRDDRLPSPRTQARRRLDTRATLPRNVPLDQPARPHLPPNPCSTPSAGTNLTTHSPFHPTTAGKTPQSGKSPHPSLKPIPTTTCHHCECARARLASNVRFRYPACTVNRHCSSGEELVKIGTVHAVQLQQAACDVLEQDLVLSKIGFDLVHDRDGVADPDFPAQLMRQQQLVVFRRYRR